MKIYRECINEKCANYRKKVSAKNNSAFCSKCGGELFHVCRSCHTVLSDDRKTICERCAAKRSDNIEKAKACGKYAAAAASLIFSAVPIINKTPVGDMIKNFTRHK